MERTLSPEVNFIETQITMMDDACTELRRSGFLSPNAFSRYEQCLRHLRTYAVQYHEKAGSELLTKFFVRFEKLEEYARQTEKRQI